jgi:hypothetical protein
VLCDAMDRISNLPDELLIDHIISKLPSKLGAATTLLSARWRNLFSQVETYDLSDVPPKKRSHDRFDQTLKDLFLSGQRKPPLKSLKLSLTHHFTAEHYIERCLEDIFKEYKLENLIIYSTIQRLYITENVFNSKILLSLNLEGIRVPDFSPNGLVCLKNLRLALVTFVEKKVLVSLLSSCPNLEVLDIQSVKVLNSACDVSLTPYLHLKRASLYASSKSVTLPIDFLASASSFSTNVEHSLPI